MTTTATMKPLIAKLADAMNRYEILAFDEDDYRELGKPCTAAQLAMAEQDLGQSLPPSYRAFLELHNGWTDFIREAPVLAVEARHKPWFRRRAKEIRDHQRSFDNPDFLKHGFLILAHPDVSTVLYLDKTKPTGNGELEVVAHCLREGEFGRYPNLEAYFQDHLADYERMIEEEKR